MTDQPKKERRGLGKIIGNHMEVFVSLAALITAVAAVIITLEQTKVMREEAELERKNARISVLPSVWVSTHIDDSGGEPYFKVVLTNKGLGPAVIEGFDVSYKGQPVHHWDELARKASAHAESERDFQKDLLRSSRSPVSPGLMLESGGEAQPLEVYGNDEPEGMMLLMRSSSDIMISVCYCSLYEDCFRTQLFRRPEPVEACETPEKLFVSHGFFRE